ncbi:hypothetical protein L2E82_11283 [Cichorium intybus]|uniref:Uncharacterized protein n=1 Tax=Cichorium intybus TaxID=13427 RepID=A0ACB9GCN2_CICIN|nr:hypothetical protein L2E82_11283 [Cichorium intybus]
MLLLLVALNHKEHVSVMCMLHQQLLFIIEGYQSQFLICMETSILRLAGPIMLERLAIRPEYLNMEQQEGSHDRGKIGMKNCSTSEQPLEHPTHLQEKVPQDPINPLSVAGAVIDGDENKMGRMLIGNASFDKEVLGKGDDTRLEIQVDGACTISEDTYNESLGHGTR